MAVARAAQVRGARLPGGMALLESLLAQLTLWLVAGGTPWLQARTILCGTRCTAWGSGAGKWGVTQPRAPAGVWSACRGVRLGLWAAGPTRATFPIRRPVTQRVCPRARLLHARCSCLRAALSPERPRRTASGKFGLGSLVALSCGGLMAVGAVWGARAPGRRRAGPSHSSANHTKSRRPRRQPGQASGTSPTPSTGP